MSDKEFEQKINELENYVKEASKSVRDAKESVKKTEENIEKCKETIKALKDLLWDKQSKKEISKMYQVLKQEKENKPNLRRKQ